MANSGTGIVRYQQPHPFVLPCILAKTTAPDPNLAAFFPVDLIPRETLHYSAKVLEEIMFQINVEYELRGTTKPVWKKYKGDALHFTQFQPDPNGNNLKNITVRTFSVYVRDIQSAIDRLISDGRIPDTRASYLARVFANNTTGNPGQPYNNANKLKNGIKTPNGILNPLTRAQSGDWPFDRNYIDGCITYKGIGFNKNKIINVNTGAGSIETQDPTFPQSEIGATTPSGIAGIDTRMDATNRPVFNKVNTKNTSLGVGKGLTDYDQGYAYLAHIPHVVQMLRWQPPEVEWFPNNITPRDYVSNLHGPNTPNLPWYFGQPVETPIQQNWGFWLIKGFAGVQNGRAIIRAYNNDMAQAGERGTCPFSTFFPPPIVNCACGYLDSAYFIWYAVNTGFTWDELAPIQSTRAVPKPVGRNTRMKVSFTGSNGGGSNENLARFSIGIRTARVSNVNLQPFHYIAQKDMPFSGTIDVNIQEQMHAILGTQYPIGGLDNIEAIILLVEAGAAATWTCSPQDGPNGSFLPDSCNRVKICTVPDVTLSIDYVSIYEPAIVGDVVSAYT